MDSPWPQSPISTLVLCLQPLPFAKTGHHTLPVVKLPWIRITKDWVSCPWSALRIGVSWCFLPLSALVLVGTSYPPCMKLYSDFISTWRPSRAAYKSSFMSSIDPRIMKNKRYQKHSMFTTCKCQSKWLVFFKNSFFRVLPATRQSLKGEFGMTLSQRKKTNRIWGLPFPRNSGKCFLQIHRLKNVSRPGGRWRIDSSFFWFIDWLIHSLDNWFVGHSSLHSLIHPIIHPSIYSSIHVFVRSFIHAFHVHCPTPTPATEGRFCSICFSCFSKSSSAQVPFLKQAWKMVIAEWAITPRNGSAFEMYIIPHKCVEFINDGSWILNSRT